MAAPAEAEPEADVEVEADVEAEADVADEAPETPAIFSPEGSRLFLRAKAALKRLDEEGDGSPDSADSLASSADESEDEPEDASGKAPEKVSQKASKHAARDESRHEPKSDAKGEPKGELNSEPVNGVSVEAEPASTEAEAAQEDEAQGKPEAVDGHSRAAATTPARIAQPAQQPSGHFIAPTAVAVAPAAPVRRPLVEGGFDFFGTKQGVSRDALEAVQNEDLADVVGQEALALHKAEAEAEFKPADEQSRGIGQVIDLTAHDETEQIDVQGLRSAVS